MHATGHFVYIIHLTFLSIAKIHFTDGLRKIPFEEIGINCLSLQTQAT